MTFPGKTLVLGIILATAAGAVTAAPAEARDGWGHGGGYRDHGRGGGWDRGGWRGDGGWRGGGGGWRGDGGWRGGGWDRGGWRAGGGWGYRPRCWSEWRDGYYGPRLVRFCR